MCGIALILDPAHNRSPRDLEEMLAILAPRGEVPESRCTDGVLAGVQRLPIVDRHRAVQPWISSDGRWLLCYNGELFNYRELRAELAALGHEVRGASDTEVVAEAFAAWGEQAVTRFRGEFALVIADTAGQRVYLARDGLGVKPLYWARRDGALHVASEIKALVPLGTSICEVPPGHHGWATATGTPALRPHLDLRAMAASAEPLTDPAQAAKLVRAAFEDSVRVRVDTDLPVGVILSGGLDSSLTLLHVRESHPDCVAFTIGAPGSDDLRYARRLCADLCVPHEVIEVAPRQVGLVQVRDAIWMSELSEYGDIINAVVSVPLFRRVKDVGIKVVLTGDGSDELFGGYQMYQQAPPDQLAEVFVHKLRNLARTELQRVDRAGLGHGVEVRVPFLDLSMVELATRLAPGLKYRDGTEKWILREAFADVLPGYVAQRPKSPMSHSSGLHERARLYKPLFPRIARSAGYDRCAPVRRDFSAVLESCGHDLGLALEQLAARPDYTAAERLRDLAGAVRWNVTGAARQGAATLARLRAGMPA
jgi:asparagine synthase (glutamine-hydrolysing)